MTEPEADDPIRFSAPYRVRFDEAGADGLLRASGLLRYAQDVAWQHSEARGLTRGWYAERGLAWVVRAAELEMLQPIPVGVTLDVETRVIGYQRFWAQRQARMALPGGEQAARVRADWVMIDGRGRLGRVPSEIADRFPAPILDGPLLRVALPRAPGDAARSSFVVRRHELDPMDHPNNAIYVDWLEEALVASGTAAAVRLVGSPTRRLQLEYAAAASPGATIQSAAWRAEGGWAVRLTDAAGLDLLRARIVG